MHHRQGAAVLVAAALLGGCGPGSTVPPAMPTAAVPDELGSLPTTTIEVDGQRLRVAVAETPDARRRGLMGVTDLGSLDGLLFAYPGPVDATFHMRDVPIPLDIAFFDADGRLLGVARMDVCDAEPCPGYRSPAPLRWALESEAGRLADLSQGARLSLEP